MEEENAPAYGEMTGFTEPIRQKRVMAVTDDAIVLFDWMKGVKEHNFDFLLQIKGFIGIDAEGEDASVHFLKHTASMDPNPISDAQFITDCCWYEAHGGTRARFQTVFTETDAGESLRGERSNYNEPGLMKLDVHMAWPKENIQMIGDVAVYKGWPGDCDGYTIPMEYKVYTDKNLVKKEAIDCWVLGTGQVDISLEEVHELQLCVHALPMRDELGRKVVTPQSLFWGKAMFTLEDGRRIPISELEESRVTLENVDKGYGPGKDYQGGRVVISGERYPDAFPANPVDHEKDARITIQLDGLGAIRFEGLIGADTYPGDDSQRRKTYAVRARGKEARFISVIEPYEECRMIERVEASCEDQVRLFLRDGRMQLLTLIHMENEKNRVELTEWDRDGNCLDREPASE